MIGNKDIKAGPAILPADIDQAKAYVARLEAFKRKLHDISWSLESGIADNRKAAVGYRNPDPETGREPEHTGIVPADFYRRLERASLLDKAIAESGLLDRISNI